MSDTATVPIKSAWYSKINWTQAGSALTALIIAFGIDIPDKYRADVLLGVTMVTNVCTWVFRTWYNGTVAPSSLS
jgi:hypothetical protein